MNSKLHNLKFFEVPNVKKGQRAFLAMKYFPHWEPNYYTVKLDSNNPTQAVEFGEGKITLSQLVHKDEKLGILIGQIYDVNLTLDCVFDMFEPYDSLKEMINHFKKQQSKFNKWEGYEGVRNILVHKNYLTFDVIVQGVFQPSITIKPRTYVFQFKSWIKKKNGRYYVNKSYFPI